MKSGEIPALSRNGDALSLVLVNTGLQSLKSGKWNTGEEEVSRGLGAGWFAAGDGFTWESNDLDESEAKAAAAWEFAKSLIEAGEHQP